MRTSVRHQVLGGAIVLQAACLTAFIVPAHVASAPPADALVMPLPPAPASPQLSLPAVESVPGEVLVGYVASAGGRARAQARARVDARLEEMVVPAQGSHAPVELLELPSGADRGAAMRLLRSNPAVEYVEQNWIYTGQPTSSDPYFTNGSLWGMYGRTTDPSNRFGSNAAAAWAAGQTGSGKVFVGVIDEGVQVSHPDLTRRVRNPGETSNGVDDDGNGYVDDVYGWDFSGDNKSVYDGGQAGDADDHGTHVAGTIGAKSNSAGVVGVNWNVRMISAKFLTDNGGTTSDAVQAVDYFTDLKVNRGVNVVATNNSWSGAGYSQALRDAIQRANRAGILFVAAAGNGGGDGIGDDIDSLPSYPASYSNSNVVSVAAITRSGGLASFSNYGATSVDLGAPGVGIVSTTAYDEYTNYSGTSMATPHVTGAAALYAAAHPGASARTIKNALLSGAVATDSLSGRTVTGGRLNVKAALSK